MKKTSYILLLFVATSFVLSSCRTELGTDTSNQTQKLVLNASLCADSQSSVAKLSTSVVVGKENQNFEYPEDAIISIRSLRTDAIEIFEYESFEECYRERNMQIDEGDTYLITAEVPNSEFIDVFGRTTVPQAVGFDVQFISSLEIPVVTGDLSVFTKRYTFELILEESDQNYFRLIPWHRDMILGEEQAPYLRSKEIKNFTNYTFEVGGAASNELFHTNGILIDRRELTDNKLIFSFETEAPFSLQEREVIEQIFFDLQTVEEDYYRYHLSTSQQTMSSSGNFVTTFTNINNGYGIFSSLSERKDSIEVN